MSAYLRGKLVRAGVSNLLAFGYPGCNATNIITDPIYSAFFIGMLEESKGNDREVDATIDDLLAEIAKAKENPA